MIEFSLILTGVNILFTCWLFKHLNLTVVSFLKAGREQSEMNRNFITLHQKHAEAISNLRKSTLKRMADNNPN